MNKNQKGFAPILIIAIIAVVAVAGYFFLSQKGKYATTTPSSNGSYSAIQNSSDLDTAANDLDNTDINQADTELNQLNSDASSF